MTPLLRRRGGGGKPKATWDAALFRTGAGVGGDGNGPTATAKLDGDREGTHGASRDRDTGRQAGRVAVRE